MRLREQDRPEIPIILEKTPRNALNFAFLRQVFPSARYIYLYRDPKQAISSLIEAWNLGLQTGRFVTFRDLPGWHLPAWCFVLPPGWRALQDKSIAEIAAFQWAACQESILQGLETMPQDKFEALNYADVVNDPAGTLTRIGKRFDIELDLDQVTDGAIPLSRTTISAPDAEKWRRHEEQIMAIWDSIAETDAKAQKFLSETRYPA